MVNFSCFSTSCLIFFTMTEFWDKPAEKSGKVLAAFLEGLPLVLDYGVHRFTEYSCTPAVQYPINRYYRPTNPPPPSNVNKIISTFFGPKWHSLRSWPFQGPKKSRFSEPTPSNGPRNGCGPHQNHFVPPHINNSTLIVISLS